MTATFAACWFIANVLVVWFLRPRHGYIERAIVSFPGAWILVGLPLTLSFGASAVLFVRGLFFS